MTLVFIQYNIFDILYPDTLKKRANSQMCDDLVAKKLSEHSDVI